MANIYRVRYHFERSGKKVGPESFLDDVLASASDYNSLSTVIVGNNGRGAAVAPGGTLVIDCVEQVRGSVIS